MDLVYADTSVLVSSFLPDAHSSRALNLLRNQQSPILCSPLTLLEFTNAVQLRVFREEISLGSADQVLGRFADERRSGLIVEGDVAESAVWSRAEMFSRMYASKVGCRSLDIYHVAFAYEHRADTFWTFDDRQQRLAVLTGLQVNLK